MTRAGDLAGDPPVRQRRHGAADRHHGPSRWLIIVVCEITPKVIGATWPEKIALPSSYLLAPLTRLLAPAVWCMNLLVGLAARPDAHPPRRGGRGTGSRRKSCAPSCSRAGHFMPVKHRAILLNLFDLETITVDDVMTPRNRVESLDVSTSEQGIREQLATCYHNKLPVHEGELNRVVGLLHVRRALSLLQRETFEAEDLRALLTEPYFIPSGTPVFTQLTFFQEKPPAHRPGRRRVRRGAGPGDARGHHRGDHRRVHHDDARRPRRRGVGCRGRRRGRGRPPRCAT